MKLSFKKHKRETGLRSVVNPYQETSIKADGHFVGQIRHSSWRELESNWRVYLRVKSDDHPGWRNAMMKPKFDSEQAVRDWLDSKWLDIQAKFELFPDIDYKPWEG